MPRQILYKMGEGQSKSLGLVKRGALNLLFKRYTFINPLVSKIGTTRTIALYNHGNLTF